MKQLIRYPARLQASTNHGKNLKTRKSGSYFYLGMDARGSMHLYVNIHERNIFTRVTVAKGYVFDALMHAMLIRPVRLPKTPFSWYSRELQQCRMSPVENMDKDQLESWHNQAQAELLAVCEKDITPEQRTACRNQMQKITDRQRAISNSILAIDSIACARSVEASYE